MLIEFLLNIHFEVLELVRKVILTVVQSWLYFFYINFHIKLTEQTLFHIEHLLYVCLIDQISLKFIKLCSIKVKLFQSIILKSIKELFNKVSCLLNIIFPLILEVSYLFFILEDFVHCPFTIYFTFFYSFVNFGIFLLYCVLEIIFC